MPIRYRAGGNLIDKMPQEGLAIIESKSKVRYSRSRASDSRVSTDAPLSTSSPSNNSFDMQQIAASLEDKMTIKIKQMMNEMKALVVTTPAPIKAVKEVCVTRGSNHPFAYSNHNPDLTEDSIALVVGETTRESTFDIHLVDYEVQVDGKGKKDPDCFKSCI
ncbi:hypothetical protein Tco_0212793 [Tanacetum coccineum]